jgi:hypothetical protein
MTTVGYAIEIDGVDEDGQHIDFRGCGFGSTGADSCYGVLARASYIQGRFRRVSNPNRQFTSGMFGTA